MKILKIDLKNNKKLKNKWYFKYFHIREYYLKKKKILLENTQNMSIYKLNRLIIFRSIMDVLYITYFILFHIKNSNY